MGVTSKWYFFLGFSNGSPKIGTFIVSKFWMFISFSNQVFLEHMKIIFYISQKDLSKGILHAPIKDDFIIALRGFVIRSQIQPLF
jgi:hypothetical protein